MKNHKMMRCALALTVALFSSAALAPRPVLSEEQEPGGAGCDAILAAIAAQLGGAAAEGGVQVPVAGDGSKLLGEQERKEREAQPVGGVRVEDHGVTNGRA